MVSFPLSKCVCILVFHANKTCSLLVTCSVVEIINYDTHCRVAAVYVLYSVDDRTHLVSSSYSATHMFGHKI